MADKKDSTPTEAAVHAATGEIVKTGSQLRDSVDTPEPPKRSRAELLGDIERGRNDLAATLDAIETKLNLPKQAKIAAGRFGNKLRVLRDENPAVLAVGAVSAAAVIGGVVWLGIRALGNRR